MIGYEPLTDFVAAPWLEQSIPGGPAMGEIVVGADINGNKGDILDFFSVEYRVAGKLEKTGMGFDTSVFLNMDQARIALEDYAAIVGIDVPEGAISSISVNVAPGVDLNEFSRSIRYGYRSENVGIMHTQAMLGNISSKLDSLLVIIAVIIGILWIVSVCVLAILFSVTLGERKREFGIYRALGATRRKLEAIILTEASFVSLAGSVLGAALLSLFFFPLSALIGLSVDLPYLQPTEAGKIALLLGGAILAAFLTGPAASLYSASKISRLATGAILREGD
jgi:putative ABC transport system permease protein